MARRTATVEKNFDDLAKEWGRKNGYEGRQGGWIYPARKPTGALGSMMDYQKPICQGWGQFFSKKKKQILDWLTHEVTAFKTFDELLNAAGGYRPTLRSDLDWRAGLLATAYDLAQQQRGDARRAFRG